MSYKKKIFISFLVIFYIYFWFITHGDFKLFIPEYNGGMDYLSKSLLRGSSETILPDVGYEYSNVNGKIVSYFSPLPALLRIIPLSLFPEAYGKLSRSFCLLGGILTVFGFYKIIGFGLSLNNFIDEKRKVTISLFSLYSFALGTPLLILMVSGMIHNESRILCLCSTIWGIYFLTKLLNKACAYKTDFILFSICCGLALISKESFGIFLYSILILIIGWIFTDYRKNKFNQGIKTASIINPSDLFILSDTILKCLIPSIIILAFQFWYNFDRYGNILSFVNREYHPNYSWQVKELGGDLNPVRLPLTLEKYLGFRLKYFKSSFPYITQLPASDIPFESLKKIYIKHFLGDYSSIPLTICSLWLILTGVLSICLIKKRREKTIVKLILLLFCLLPLLTTCCHWWIVQRYSIEFLPALVFLYFYLLKNVDFNELRKPFVFFNIFKAACIFSIYVTCFCTLEWSLTEHDLGKYSIIIPDIFNKIDSLVIKLFQPSH